jgi:dCTP deaminase
MIKSDKWIKSKCMLPLAVAHYMVRGSAFDGPFRKHEFIYGDATTDIDAEFDKIVNRVSQENNVISGSTQLEYVGDIQVNDFQPMIEPFVPTQIRTAGHDRHVRMLAMPRNTPQEMLARTLLDFDGDDEFEKRKIISRGLTSFGYDVTLAEEAAIFTNVNCAVIDPLNFTEDTLQRVIAKDGYFLMPPNSYLLGYTKEYFRMPRNVIAVALGKSTYARAGAIVNVTPIEPGFEGTVVIEIANATSLPMKVYANQGIAQFLFFESDEDCETSYADRNGGEGGKYQGQRGLVTPRG